MKNWKYILIGLIGAVIITFADFIYALWQFGCVGYLGKEVRCQSAPEILIRNITGGVLAVFQPGTVLMDYYPTILLPFWMIVTISILQSFFITILFFWITTKIFYFFRSRK